MSTNLGRSIIKKKQQTAKEARAKYATLIRAEAIEGERAPPRESGKKLKSIWETSNMEEFLSIADEREKGYTAERNTRIVVGGAVHIVQQNRIVPYTDNRDWFALSSELKIPRRPQWSFKMRADELDRAERTMFLNWRRELAHKEETHGVLLTPYEKNLEVWRQLWRVVERSDVVLEIVDARNPMAFRSVDFERYVTEHHRANGKAKECALLINKADLLTENQRRAWARFFAGKGIRFFFFAAKPLDESVVAQAADEGTSDRKIEQSGGDDDDDEEEESTATESDVSTDEPGDDDEVVAKQLRNRKEQTRRTRRLKGQPQHIDPRKLEVHREVLKQEQARPSGKAKKIAPATRTEIDRDARMRALSRDAIEPHTVLSPLQLVDQLVAMRGPLEIVDGEVPISVGMVGYPNVGKSSTINSIMGCHKVVVSATPGKTKHFQTLKVPDERRVIVCDCPGLVFPSFAATRETMICDGILPVDNVKDYTTPVEVICHRIPQHVLEAAYATQLGAEHDIDDSCSVAERILNLIARRKGYMTDHDKPNRSRIAKEMLKQYVDGRLVYVHPPPNFSFEEFLSPEALAAATGAEDEGKAKAAARNDSAAPGKGDEAEADDGDGDGDSASAASDAWEDISSADEARALSDGALSGSDDAEEDDIDGPSPKFLVRGRNAGLTLSEMFNIERNIEEPESKKRRPRKKRTNHQIEPDVVGVRITEDGEEEIMIDSDDGIVEHYGPGVEARAKKSGPKAKSKRSVRREMRREGLMLPQNKATKVIAVKGL